MLFEFVQQQWMLFLMLAVIIFLLFMDPAKRRVAGVSSVNQSNALRLLQNDKTVVLDVSEESDYKAGHISGAINSPASKLATDVDRLSKHKDRDVMLVCRNGQKSSRTASLLKKAGFSKLHILEGGMASWLKENLPVEKS